MMVFHRLRLVTRTLLTTFIAVVMVISVNWAGPGMAHASSTTCVMYGDGLKGPVRNGSFCASVAGYGLYIDHVSGTFGTTIPGLNRVCNPSLRLEVMDRKGNVITTRDGAQAIGCSWGSFNRPPELEVEWSFPAADEGFARVSLLDSGSRIIAETEHRLHS